MAERSRERGQRRPAAGSRESLKRGYARSEERNREAREALQPLVDGERPLVVTIAALAAAAVAVSAIGGYLAGVHVNGGQPKLVGALGPAALMAIVSWGLWRARYWAVLGFQIILILLIFSAVFGLAVRASTLAQILASAALAAVSGGFFYFMIRAMARIQMPERLPRD